MKFEDYVNEQFLLERDVALLDIAKCKDFKGKDKMKCRIDAYDNYIRELDKAIRTSRSDIEKKALEDSKKRAKGILFKLRKTIRLVTQ